MPRIRTKRERPSARAYGRQEFEERQKAEYGWVSRYLTGEITQEEFERAVGWGRYARSSELAPSPAIPVAGVEVPE